MRSLNIITTHKSFDSQIPGWNTERTAPLARKSRLVPGIRFSPKTRLTLSWFDSLPYLRRRHFYDIKQAYRHTAARGAACEIRPDIRPIPRRYPLCSSPWCSTQRLSLFGAVVCKLWLHLPAAYPPSRFPCLLIPPQLKYRHALLTPYSWTFSTKLVTP